MSLPPDPHQPSQEVHRMGESSHLEWLEVKDGDLIQERYKVIELLGSGGMGSVYKVEDTRTKRFYALKFLNKQQSNDASWKRFENEINATNRLDHPNLVKVHESGLLQNGQPYFIMDLVPGQSLAELLKMRGRLPLEKVLKIFVQVGFALGYAHSKGIIHRDIKPSNIMLQEPGNDTTSGSIVKLVDFGIAKLTGRDDFNQQTLTKTGEIFGSPLYMSPEQCMGSAIDHRTDLYSMGCVIYEALTGAPPLVGDSALSTMMKHQSEAPLTLKEASMGIEFPERIEQIVKKLLEKSVSERYQSAQMVTSHLAAFESIPSGTVINSVPPPIHEVDWKLDRKQARLLGVLILSAGIAIGYFLPGYQNTFTVKRPEFSGQTKERLKESVEQTLEESKKGIEKSSSTIYAEYANNPAKFSEFKDKPGRRVFHFPPEPIGTFGFVNLPTMLAVGDIQSPPKFEPVVFHPVDKIREYPQFLNRFREDEVSFLDLYFPEDQAPFMDKKLLSVDHMIPYVVKLKSISTLSLDNTTIRPENFNRLKELPKLDELWLSNINLQSKEVAQPQILGKLRVLALKDMRGVNLITEELGKSKKIHRLIMRDCDVDSNAIRGLSHCSDLSILDVRGSSKFTDECIPLLPANVESLFLYFCDLSPKCIDSFKRLKKLRELSLTTDAWSKEDFERLQRTLPTVIIKH